MDTVAVRTQVLKAYGASPPEQEELLAYNQNLFHGGAAPGDISQFPLADEPHVEVWRDYLHLARQQGLYPVLAQALVQLQFPIQAGISTTESYRLATRKGQLPPPGLPGLALADPNGLELFIHPTLAGAIPVVVPGCREDFVALLQALTKRNEPVNIPDSMGACIIGGYNNWDRVRRYRQRWQAEHPELGSEQDWLLEFSSHVVPQKGLYQDRFIVLSRGYYSNVAPDQLCLDEAEWLRQSLTLRLEHECTHYFTRRCFNSMGNNVLDEFIADYFGLLAAQGRYRADWFLRFVGLEQFPDYRPGGRLQLYLGEPPLSEGAFRVLRALVKAAADNLERFDKGYLVGYRSNLGKITTSLALVSLTLEELASDMGPTLLQQAFDRHYLQLSPAAVCS
jgi:hypothetical protein